MYGQIAKILAKRGAKSAPKTYKGGVESAGNIKAIGRDIKKGKRTTKPGSKQRTAPLKPVNPISRLDDSARQEFARRNLK